MGPKGVHVAYIVIDAVIELAWTRERFKGRRDGFFIKPLAIADEASRAPPGRYRPGSGRLEKADRRNRS
jgi:hypothetical protein